MKKTRAEKNYLIEVAVQAHYDAAKAMVDPYWNHMAEIKVIDIELQTVEMNSIQYNELWIARETESEAADELYEAMFDHKKEGDKLLKKTEPRWWRRG